MEKKYGTARQDTYGSITQRMRFSCCINGATDTYSEYVTTNNNNNNNIHTKRLMLRYMYTACLFRNCKFGLQQVLVTSVRLPRQKFDGEPTSCTKRQKQICTNSEALSSHLQHSQMHAGGFCFT